MRTVRAVRDHRAEARGQALGLRDEGLQDPTALPSDHHRGAPLLDQGKRFQALKGDPIQLGDLKLAFSDLLQGPLFGRAELDLGNGFHGGDLSRPASVRSAAGWRMGLCTSQRPGVPSKKSCTAMIISAMRRPKGSSGGSSSKAFTQPIRALSPRGVSLTSVPLRRFSSFPVVIHVPAVFSWASMILMAVVRIETISASAVPSSSTRKASVVCIGQIPCGSAHTNNEEWIKAYRGGRAGHEDDGEDVLR
jgi:hypothetical protein